MSNQINITLNGKNIKGNPDETILQVARREGIEIPTLCNDPRLAPYSSCFLCVVEIDCMRGLQPACSTKIAEGMGIETHNGKIAKARKTALDLILSNHYADCMAPCKQTCPAGVDVQGYISLIEKGLYNDAIELIKKDNPLPAICGRVCVRPCEVACRRNLLDEGTAVGIDYMKRFAADQDLESDMRYIPEVAESTGKKVAIIGAGPGGLSAAYWLQQKGHQCDIFEANPQAGGWLRYGIPEYRLPNDLLQKEVDAVTELGANIYYNKKLGDNLSYGEIKANYDATVLTIGSQRGTLLGCEGDDADNVFSGIDFLRNMEVTGQKYDFKGKNVAVVGGGNTAMDCCRTSIRCGAEKVYVIYRRTEAEMPANPIEIHESKLEGVEYLFLTNPKQVNKDENGVLKSVTCLKMELGAPDASGRRRPVPVEGSDFELELDYILAAIGQKTDINFIEDVNKNSENGELKANRWGDIDADSKTLQTGIPNMFAAGDGVSGPATIIEAIAQAKTAVRSCHQYLMGEELAPEASEFISKKDNFKAQVKDDYVGHFVRQNRYEMPVLDPENRFNFKEVELGYDDEAKIMSEAERCLECGCTEYYTCDLKRYATEYGAEQGKFEGEYHEHKVDFSHPYIEIDNNKCILCGRCVRMCKEVVGANALGLVERGFNTYVAPSMGNSLCETDCESCGMCIETCPTGAITENVNFKPGPVTAEKVRTIDFMTSGGGEIELEHRNGFFLKASGVESENNPMGSIARQAKFGYSVLNKERIQKPLLKVGEEYKEISFEEAYALIKEQFSEYKAEETAVYAGARLSNEELYLAQKLARGVLKTNNLNSFHYMGRGKVYARTNFKNVPVAEMEQASRIYVVGDNLNKDHHQISYQIHNAAYLNEIPVEQLSKNVTSLSRKVSAKLQVKSYYNFFKAANYFLLNSGKENALYIKDNCQGFDAYKEELLKADYEAMIAKTGISREELEAWALAYNMEMNAVLVIAENETCNNTLTEIINLSMLTGKLGKTASGLIILKEKNNAKGVMDMGVHPVFGPGARPLGEVLPEMREKWGTETCSSAIFCQQTKLNEKQIKAAFVLGEDPVGCAISNETKAWFDGMEFLVVQDYFMTETAQKANLILPATLPFETGGSFTDTQGRINAFDKEMASTVQDTNPEQLISIMKAFGTNGISTVEESFMEAVSLLPKEELNLRVFESTEGKHREPLFNHTCDVMTKLFEEEFEQAFE